ncbi:MAG: DUF4129 domain-containing protein [Chloroflexi bacterium]|nr:MAG: DUF4129 domain-containing protein [Chloroflexota bacterium]
MRRLCAALVVAAGCGIGAQMTHAAAAGSCAALQYLAALNQADAALAAAPSRPSAAAAVLTGLVTADPSLQHTLTPIIRDVDASPPDTTDARASLDGLIQVLALPPGATCAVDSSSARAALNDVYRSRVFANLDQNSQPGWLGQILNWIDSLLNATGRTLGAAGSIALGSAVFLAALALAWWRLRGTLGSRVARAIEKQDDTGDDPAREWTLASRAAERGRYRDAIRHAFRSALLDAAWRGRLAVDASWTTRELLAAARGDADLVAALAPAAAMFDRAWYSGEPAGAEEWEVARARCEAVRSIARSRAPERAA